MKGIEFYKEQIEYLRAENDKLHKELDRLEAENRDLEDNAIDIFKKDALEELSKTDAEEFKTFIINALKRAFYRPDQEKEKEKIIKPVKYNTKYSKDSNNILKNQFDESVLTFKTKAEADAVRDNILHFVEQYGVITFVDIYDMTLRLDKSSYIDTLYGWNNLTAENVNVQFDPIHHVWKVILGKPIRLIDY